MAGYLVQGLKAVGSISNFQTALHMSCRCLRSPKNRLHSPLTVENIISAGFATPPVLVGALIDALNKRGRIVIKLGAICARFAIRTERFSRSLPVTDSSWLGVTA